jgi:hypothetical protein
MYGVSGRMDGTDSSPMCPCSPRELELPRTGDTASRPTGFGFHLGVRQPGKYFVVSQGPHALEKNASFAGTPPVHGTLNHVTRTRPAAHFRSDLGQSTTLLTFGMKSLSPATITDIVQDRHYCVFLTPAQGRRLQASPPQHLQVFLDIPRSVMRYNAALFVPKSKRRPQPDVS